jgi:hypothetical protein
MRFHRWIVPALFLFLFVAGCAEKGPILLAITYQPPAKKTEYAPSVTVGVSPFKDLRDVSPSFIGKRTVSSGLQNDLVIRGTVSESVTSILEDALKARGMAVKESGPWNLSEEGIPQDGARIVIGGEIKAFRIDSTSIPFKTTMKTAVQMKIYVGDPAEKKIIRVLDVDSKVEQETLYSREKLSALLSEALSSALDQIFQDDVIRKKLQ